MRTESADIAVLGSGFGGSLMALIAGKLGLRPVVVDRAAHPRFAIGESSTPAANMILRRLVRRYGLDEVEPLSRYGTWQETYPGLAVGRKRGFSYFQHYAGELFQPDDRHTNELLVTASGDDYSSDTHWLRSDLDAFLARRVRSAGIPLYERTEIVQVERVDEGWRLVGQTDGGKVAIEASFIIDGTGRGRVLREELNLGRGRPARRVNSRALFAHFRGVDRWTEILSRKDASLEDHPFTCDRAALHHLLDGGWMWQLRFENDLVSAGIVMDTRKWPLTDDLGPIQEWNRWLQRYPSLHEQFSDAVVQDPPGSIIRTGKLQRRTARTVGRSWALLPYTAGFVDPIHSTGIAQTLAGIEFLAFALDEHWGESTMPAVLERYESRLQAELAFVDKLAALWYESLDSFRLSAAASMFYFAAATTYEHHRMNDFERSTDRIPPRLFLCADEEPLVRAVTTAVDRLSQLNPDEKRQAANCDRFETWAAEVLEPYNRVGLFRSETNMYTYTAAPTESAN